MHFQSAANENICHKSQERSKTSKLVFKVKFDSAIGLPIYGFLLICNSNVGP